MAWNEAVVTNEGLKLLSECMTEGNIIITRAVSGEGYADPISLMAQKDVSSNLHPLNIAYIHTAEGIITVNVRIQNNGTDTSYTIRQIGLFAKKNTADNEILFALIQDSNGEVIPSSKENPEYLSEFDFVIPISNSENINANITPNTFATMEDVSETEKVINGHILDKSNPHSVTKSQVGLGNVPNVTTNDQTPTYSDTTTFATLSSGEKISLAFAKIKLAITNLINHIANKTNPHSVTKSQVGLDKVENKSSADIRGELTKSDVTTALGFTPPSTDTKYSLPLAASTVRGGAKIGYTANGKNYPVQLSNEQMYVNVPWTDNNTTYSDFVKSGTGAKSGLVPAPSTTAGTTKYLREDGTWQVPPNNAKSAVIGLAISAVSAGIAAAMNLNEE